jgi:hypothetical protein
MSITDILIENTSVIIETDITAKQANTINFKTDADLPSVRTGNDSLGVKFVAEAISGSSILETILDATLAEYIFTTEINSGVL